VLNRNGALAAIAGGAFWVWKGSQALLLATEPPLLFVLAQGLFGLALLGLDRRLPDPSSGLGRIGRVLAYLAIICSGVTVLYELVGPPGPASPPWSVLYAVGFAGWFGGLLFLGWAHLRVGVRWRALPLCLGLLLPLQMLVTPHLEVPIITTGLGWLALGWLMWANPGH